MIKTKNWLKFPGSYRKRKIMISQINDRIIIFVLANEFLFYTINKMYTIAVLISDNGVWSSFSYKFPFNWRRVRLFTSRVQPYLSTDWRHANWSQQEKQSVVFRETWRPVAAYYSFFLILITPQYSPSNPRGSHNGVALFTLITLSIVLRVTFCYYREVSMNHIYHNK